MLDDSALLARARAVLLGLAIGDALGAPADVHRSVRAPWVRGRLWAGSAELDAERVSRPLLPFAPTLYDARGISATDDTEEAVAAAICLLAADAGTDANLFARWLAIHADRDAWLGVAARSAERNAARGLVPPVTGNDNPAANDDAAVPAGIVCGILHAGDEAAASASARRYAQITHAGDGIDAAAFAAVLVARALDGAVIGDAAAIARREITPDSWLEAGIDAALAIVRDASDAFDAIPSLIRELSPRMYSHAGTVAETLPLALAVTMLAEAQASRAIPLSLTIARKADSLPAFVGAFCGALGGGAAPEPWYELDAVRGHLLPAVAGSSLDAVAADLVAHARRGGNHHRGYPRSENR